mmetsp:Transcript_13127/g.29594  ORF Transcript_13127/g.29594 Transcript_13127/m.29594 type:complete len:154 (-) Transcript_13127:1207-1668(-)
MMQGGSLVRCAGDLASGDHAMACPSLAPLSLVLGTWHPMQEVASPLRRLDALTRLQTCHWGTCLYLSPRASAVPKLQQRRRLRPRNWDMFTCRNIVLTSHTQTHSGAGEDLIRVNDVADLGKFTLKALTLEEFKLPYDTLNKLTLDIIAYDYH